MSTVDFSKMLSDNVYFLVDGDGTFHMMHKVTAKCLECSRVSQQPLNHPRCNCGNEKITRFYLQLPLGFTRAGV